MALQLKARTNHLLVIGIILFLLADLFLFYLLVVRRTNNSDLRFVKNKEITFNSSSGINLSPNNSVFVKEGHPETQVLREGLIYARIIRDVYYDDLIKAFVIVVSIPIKTSSIKTPVLLRTSYRDKIFTLIAKEGIVGGMRVETWQDETLEKLASLMRKGDPIVFGLWLQKPTNEFVQSEDCNDECKGLVKSLDLYYENNNHLISAISSSQTKWEDRFVGPVSRLIIYEN